MNSLTCVDRPPCSWGPPNLARYRTCKRSGIQRFDPSNADNCGSQLCRTNATKSDLVKAALRAALAKLRDVERAFGAPMPELGEWEKALDESGDP